MIIQVCSNCGRRNEYERKDWKGREFTKCYHCFHTLSICNFFDFEVKE